MKKALIVIVIIIIVGLVVYFGLTKKSQFVPVENPVPPTTVTTDVVSAPAPTPVASAPATPKPTGPIINIQNMQFIPVSVTIKAGGSVTWVNNDTVTHKIDPDAPEFVGTETLAPGQSYTHTFKEAGIFYYHCAFHPEMKGSITIK